MKIWWIPGRIEAAIFDFGESRIVILGFEDKDDETGLYDFSDSHMLYATGVLDAKVKEEITSVFWKYIPDEDELMVQQKLLKTVFEQS